MTITDFNSVDLCPNCGLFHGVLEQREEYTKLLEPLHQGLVKSVRLPKGMRRFRRVKRNCPKCGGEMKHIRRSVSGDLYNISTQILLRLDAEKRR